MQAKALLFDMDGTLVDSSGIIETIWRRWANIHGLDIEALLRFAHGRRAIDTVRHFAPKGLDPIVEAQALVAQAASETDGIFAIKGAAGLLEQLHQHEWAVVTSAETALATRWLVAAGLPLPGVMICAQDVAQSKPDPEAYLLAMARLDCDAGHAVIFEDALAGLTAARATGARVTGVGPARSHTHLADIWIDDFEALTISRDDGLRLVFRE
jgi:sugar-phosphatase